MATRRKPRRTAATVVKPDGTRVPGHRPDDMLATDSRMEGRVVSTDPGDLPDIKHFVTENDCFIGGVYMRAYGTEDEQLVHTVPVSVPLPSAATLTNEDGEPLSEDELPPEPDSPEFRRRKLEVLDEKRRALEDEMMALAEQVREDDENEDPDPDPDEGE